MTSTTIAAMKQALEALENHPGNYKLTKTECRMYEEVVDSLRTAIENESNSWKEAVIEQIMLTEGAPPNLDDPVAAIKYLIDFHVQLESDYWIKFVERASHGF